METSIPYDPSLVIGSVLNKERITNLKKISDLKTPICIARNSLNSKMSIKRSLEMTLIELRELNIDTSEIETEITNLEKEIVTEANKYLSLKIANERKIIEVESSIGKIEQEIDTPVDFKQTKFEHLPLASASLKMEIQYFSFSETRYGQDKNLKSMKKMISSSTGIFGADRSTEATTSAIEQATAQMLHYEVQGTILITATCTHKNITLMSPLILNPDKCIAIWNQIYPHEIINTSSIPDLKTLVDDNNKQFTNVIPILSGARFGSSLIGMVHITKSNKPKSLNRKNNNILSDIEDAITTHNVISELSGDISNQKQLMDNLNIILSNNNISSHVTITSIGSIPKVTSNLTQNISKNFLNEANNLAIDQSFSIESSEQTSNQTTTSNSDKNTKRKKNILSIEGEKLKSVMTAFSEIDLIKNQTIDINSLMQTLDNFIENADKNNSGAPIGFYMTKVNKVQIIKNWLNKHY